MWWVVSWLIVVAAYIFVITVLWPSPGEMCVLTGGRWVDLNGLTACIG